MKAKIPVWIWWVAVAAALVLAVREVSWLDARITEHRARRHAEAIARAAEAPAATESPKPRRHLPIPISGFGPL